MPIENVHKDLSV